MFISCALQVSHFIVFYLFFIIYLIVCYLMNDGIVNNPPFEHHHNPVRVKLQKENAVFSFEDRQL